MKLWRHSLSPGIITVILLLIISYISAAQNIGITINGIQIEKKSDWINDKSTVRIENVSGIPLEFEIIPDSGQVFLGEWSFPPALIMDKKKEIGESPVQYGNKIKKFRVEIETDKKTGEPRIHITMKMGNKINLSPAKVALLIPVPYECGKSLFRRFFPRKEHIYISENTSQQ